MLVRRVSSGIGGLVLLLVAAMMLYLYSPWHRSWWPGRQEASHIPSACTAVDRAVVERAVPQAGPGKADDRSSEYTLRTACTWTPIDESGTGQLEIQYRLHRMVASDGGIENAKAAFRSDRRVRQMANNQRQRPVGGLGDEAFIDDDQLIKHLAVRRANVLVLVTYQVPFNRDWKAQPAADLVGLGRAAIERVDLDA